MLFVPFSHNDCIVWLFHDICVSIHSSRDTQKQIFRPETVPVMPLTASLASCHMPQQFHSNFLHTMDS